MNAWIWLTLAIVAEVTATTALKASVGWSRPGPVMAVVCGYGLAFYALSQVLRSIPVGISYAIWSGAGLVLVALVDWALYAQRLRPAQLGGMAVIGVGIVWLVLSTPAEAQAQVQARAERLSGPGQDPIDGARADGPDPRLNAAPAPAPGAPHRLAPERLPGPPPSP